MQCVTPDEIIRAGNKTLEAKFFARSVTREAVIQLNVNKNIRGIRHPWKEFRDGLLIGGQSRINEIPSQN